MNSGEDTNEITVVNENAIEEIDRKRSKSGVLEETGGENTIVVSVQENQENKEEDNIISAKRYAESSTTDDGTPSMSAPSIDSSSTTTVRCLLNAKESGGLIGVAGSHIKHYRSESGCKVQISTAVPNCNERILSIIGPIEGAEIALKLVLLQLEQVKIQLAAENGETVASGEVQFSLNYLCPAKATGALLGRKGANIKALRETTGANISVSSDPLPNSTERSVIIKGNYVQITNSMIVMTRQVSLEPVSHNTEYVPSATVSGYANYAQPRARQSQSGTKPRQRTGYGQSYDNYAQNYQAYDQAQAYGYADANGYAQAQAQAQAQAYAATGDPSAYLQPPPPQQLPDGLFQQVVNIPNDYMGCVIGKRGANINEVRSVSGARVKIADSVPGGLTRDVFVSGSVDSVQHACHLINASLQQEMRRKGVI